MRKTLKLLVCGALLIAALFSFSAFTSTPSAHAATITRNTHVGFSDHAQLSTTVSSASCPKTVQEGDSGSAVKLAQKSLNWWYNTPSTGFKTWYNNEGYYPFIPLTEDGNFGIKTEEGVMIFQTWWGLKVDGVVGPATWHALGHC